MNSAPHPASIASWIAIGTALLTASFGMTTAIKSRRPAGRDLASSLMLGAAFLLMISYMAAGAAVASLGLNRAGAGLLQVVLGLTAVFALVGFGTVRGLRSGSASKSPRA